MPNFSDTLELPRLRQPKPGTFGPKRPPPGRALGNANKITKDLKAAIVDAAATHGFDGAGTGALTGYLLFLASEHPRAFAGLLAKLLPLQLDGTVNSAVVAAVRVVTVAAGNYLSAEDVAKLQPMTIESEAIDDPIESEDEPEDEVEPEPPEEPAENEHGMRLIRAR